MHNKGYIHLDIKPANILCSKKGDSLRRVKFIKFINLYLDKDCRFWINLEIRGKWKSFYRRSMWYIWI